MPRCLLLDLDGTLVDSAPDLAAALDRLMAARGLPGFAPEAVIPMIGDGVQALVERALAARRLPPDAAAVAEFAAHYRATCAVATRAYPGVLDGLTRLAGAGWRIGVCTNKPAALARAVLAATGIAPFVAALGGGDSFAVRKPDPGHVLATLAEMGGVAGRAVMAGDHRNDVRAAAGAGLPCIFAAWGYGTPDMAAGAAAVAASFTEMEPIAARLLPD